MRKYYTSLDMQNGEYIGTVYDASSNQEVYKTKAYPSQVQVTQDVTTFLQTSNPPKVDPVQPQQYQNTFQPTVITGSVSRGGCCGRRQM